MFGSTTNNNNNSGGGIFGSSNNNNNNNKSGGGGIFGNTNNTMSGNNNNQGGSGVQKFDRISDPESKLKFCSITAMDCYKTKSFEELRCEDYMQNRLGPGGGNNNSGGGMFGSTTNNNNNSGGGGMFGSNNNTTGGGGLFGSNNNTNNNNNTMFGGNTTGGGGMFGSTNTNNNNNSGGGLFGTNNNNNNSGGGLFGSSNNNNNTSGSIFGGNNNNKNTSGGGIFGNTNNNANNNTGGSLFGGNNNNNNNNNNTGGSLFGGNNNNNNNSGGGLFGSTNNNNNSNNSGGGLFGNTNNTNNSGGGGGLFGNTNNNNNTGGSIFGNTGTNNNNNNNNTGGSIFGNSNNNNNNNTGGSIFGNTNNNNNSGGGIFGNNTNNNNNSGGSIFGNSGNNSNTNNNTGGSIFGNSGNNNNNTGGGMFGNNNNNNNSVGGLFGNNNNSGNNNSIFGGNNNTGGGGGIFGNSNNNNNGGLGLFGNNNNGGNMNNSSGNNNAAQNLGPVDPYGLITNNPHPPRPLGLVMPKMTAKGPGSFLWKSSPDAMTRPTPRTPSLSRSPSYPENRSPRNSISGSGSQFSLPPAVRAGAGASGNVTPRSYRDGARSPNTPFMRHDTAALRESRDDSNGGSTFRLNTSAILRSPQLTPKSSAGSETLIPLRKAPNLPPLPNAPLEDSRTPEQADAAGGGWAIIPTIIRKHQDAVRGIANDDEESPMAASDLVPILDRSDYFSRPSIEMMKMMTEKQLSQIDNLVIGRHGFGEITWHGVTDVRQVNFDKIVHIDKAQVNVMEDPNLLNRSNVLKKEAVVNLVVKFSRPHKAQNLDPDVVKEKMRNFCAQNGRKFIDWNGESILFNAHL